jgi:hypothetical protein
MIDQDPRYTVFMISKKKQRMNKGSAETVIRADGLEAPLN